jgi:hypothetical protein
LGRLWSLRLHRPRRLSEKRASLAIEVKFRCAVNVLQSRAQKRCLSDARSSAKFWLTPGDSNTGWGPWVIVFNLRSGH